MMFETFGKLFSFDSMKQTLTKQEQDAVSCLLDRAQHYGGADDCMLLCIQSGILLLRLEQKEQLQANGFLFASKYAPVIWVNLPELIAELYCLDIRTVSTDYMVQLEVRQPELYKELSAFTCTQLQPENIGFTHIDPTVYGECGIAWTALQPQRETRMSPPIIPPVAEKSSKLKDVMLVPPTLLRRRWLLRDADGAVGKPDSIEYDRADWYELLREIEDCL